jgi:hypothetical protein
MTKRRAIAIEVVLWVFALFLAWVFIRQGGRAERHCRASNGAMIVWL